MKRPQLLASLLALVIFGLGAAAGALTHRLVIANSVNASDDWRTRYINEMHARLRLSNQQIDRLNDILDDSRTKVRTVKDRYKPEMLQIKQDQISQIRSMLSSAQAASYTQLVDEQEAKAKEQDARDKIVEQQRADERRRREPASSNAP